MSGQENNGMKKDQDHSHGAAHSESGGSKKSPIALVISEIELLLAEKRTALSVMRTGIAVLALPLSIVSVLIVTSRYYTASQVIHWLISLSVVNVLLVVLGFYLVMAALHRIRTVNRRIQELKVRFRDISELIE